MTLSASQLYGAKLGASDGEIGHVKDCYFDDRSWAVRYLVADTGFWLTGRKVLISPHALGSLSRFRKVLRVHLTKAQIEGCPPIESHKPVSRQYEEEYYKYYGWPYYWRGDALWGLSGFPILEQTSRPFVTEPVEGVAASPERPDAHLRSTKAVTGYRLEAGDGVVGHISDFLIDARSWAIDFVVARIGHRLSGREIRIRANQVDRISWDESTVFTRMTKEGVEHSPAHPGLAGAESAR